MDGRPSGLMQQGYWHLVQIGGGHDEMTHFVKYVVDTNGPMEQEREREPLYGVIIKNNTSNRLRAETCPFVL